MTGAAPEAREAYRIGVIADTHGLLRPEIFEIFEGVTLILHAGDFGNERILAELEAIAPVAAVAGNVDGVPQARWPSRRELETPAGRIAMTHGHLPSAPSTDLELMARSFSKFRPDIIVFGHSHIPYLGE